MDKQILIDFSVGRLGTFIRQETILGFPNLVNLYYKPLGKKLFPRTLKIANIPISGIVDIGSETVETDYGWKVITTDGNTNRPSVILHALNLKYTNQATQISEMMKEISTQREIMKTEKSEMERSQEAKLDEKLKKVLSAGKRRKSPFSKYTDIGVEDF